MISTKKQQHSLSLQQHITSSALNGKKFSKSFNPGKIVMVSVYPEAECC